MAKVFDPLQCSCLEKPMDRGAWWAQSLVSQRVGLKNFNPEYSLEGLMLKLQYFGHLMRRDDSLKETLILGKIEGRKRRGNRG